MEQLFLSLTWDHKKLMKFWKSATVSLILARLASTSASMLWARSCSRHLQYYTNTLYTPAVIHYHGYYINTLYPPAAILQPGGHPGQVPCKLFPADGLLAEQLAGQGQGRLRQLVQHQPPVLVIIIIICALFETSSMLRFTNKKGMQANHQFWLCPYCTYCMSC